MAQELRGGGRERRRALHWRQPRTVSRLGSTIRCVVPHLLTSLKPGDGAFTHIEYRSCEAVVSAGIVRAARAATTAAMEGFDGWPSACLARDNQDAASTTRPCSKPARCPAT